MTYETSIDLSAHVRKASVALLQARLSDALDLEAQAKQAHWNVRGRHFLQLHGLFDAVHGQVEEFVDLLAERITTLGHVADGRVQTTAGATTLYEYPLAAHGGDAHIRALAASLALFGKAVRAAIDSAAAEGDATTADLFTQISRESDKQLWLLEAHLLAD
ncbi:MULTISPECIES: DNA starvation/stationary phase protection protein Dps [unclassified Novosphingobium]|uniref:DNA starvation/stationary phase protection protein Dps n=1 Tax=unclassified Novosphingobium TaxID=2644732 RepID=UPI000D31643C|nr:MULTISPECIES: DNA starvation/stationary phase protection protein Dps [unclassified Novosphingobium]MBB3357932.1 starvation-inducible DNA-binding protein [Novosphingobium sp. BK256]MBB3374293.1 starvation-inducible DNA-binding protein [Novosphingobium sp. BK280]MBB3378705.1 starvation-inducible DNA-binding protein [Novosphingobium sp. BK258]MBB3420399.1 starvation-inducible DNA-binding protein [Novosphingobium sp. BK267]MBB3448479.1 starvation-inducible DNA-binding protein [Novosphingobium s